MALFYQNSVQVPGSKVHEYKMGTPLSELRKTFDFVSIFAFENRP